MDCTNFLQSTIYNPLRGKVGQLKKRKRVLCWSVYTISLCTYVCIELTHKLVYTCRSWGVPRVRCLTTPSTNVFLPTRDPQTGKVTTFIIASIDLKPGLGTAFFSVRFVPFFSVL